MNIQDFIIDGNRTVLNAMEQLDELAFKVLFIEDEDGIKASLTDGDIRRYILRNGDLNSPVSEVANRDPKYLINAGREEALRFLKQNAIEAVPLVDENLRIYDVVYWNDEQLKLKRNHIGCPVVMMAGGKGTRLKPYTNILPKPLIPVGEKPIAEHIIDQFCAYGCNEYHLILNYKKNMIKAYFGEIERDYEINYADEDEPLGTGGGLSLLKRKIKETFILTNCDILINEDISKIFRYHKDNKNLITMVCSLVNYQIPYGIVHLSESGKIASLEEKPEMSFFTNTGCYIVEPEVLDGIPDNTYINFPDIMESYMKKGMNVSMFPISSRSWFDMGQKDELEKMRLYLEGERS
ncbi:MAG: NTP transferase domain-containing protein [Lachnospiraceae bacterium]|nr:NTP transferase domain-containing protein [Lachnospiraceae bacterium]